MQYLSLEKNNLSEMHEDLLPAALVKLTSADLRWANLSCQQVSLAFFSKTHHFPQCRFSKVTCILTGSLEGSTLQELQLGMIWGEVEDSLLARAKAVIPQLDLEMMRNEPVLDWPEETDWFSDSD